MTQHAEWYHWDGENLILSVQVQPKSSRDEIVGPHNDCLKVRITAPPIDGKANAALIAAAPDMLSVLLEVENIFSPQTEAERLAFKLVQQAINKAEGEA